MLDLEGRQWILDANAAYRRSLAADTQHDLADRALDMPGSLTADGPGSQSLRALVDFARAAIGTQRDVWVKAGLLLEVDRVLMLPPIVRPGKIIMVGSNYRKSAAPQTRPQTFAAFAKFASCLVGHDQPVTYPAFSNQFDYEAELGVVIGRTCKNISPQEAGDVIAGYLILNDLSMRDLLATEKQIGAVLFGKNADTSLPAGPFLVTRDEILDPQALTIECWVNGELRQSDTTANMIFPIGEIVARLSRLTLEPGDIIGTGSPGGSGIGWDPPERGLLKIGDVVEVAISGLGRLRNHIVA